MVTINPQFAAANSFIENSTGQKQSFGQDVYTDLNQLKNINTLADKDQHAAFKKMAQQFEGLFLQLMLKTMREANSVFANDQSSEMELHQSMFDNQLALNLSGDRGIGLADAFYQQMIVQYSSVKPDKVTGSASASLLANYSPSFNSAGSGTVNTRADAVKPSEQALDLNSPQDFVDAIYPHAERVAERLGIDPEVLIAQSALETGWGKHLIADKQGRSSNNFFNIKADGRWSGDRVRVQTVEFKDGLAQRENANFRRYSDITESFTDYAQFILSEPRYQDARKSESSHDYIRSLQRSGYATDPEYADKVIELLDQDVIKKHRNVQKSAMSP